MLYILSSRSHTVIDHHRLYFPSRVWRIDFDTIDNLWSVVSLESIQSIVALIPLTTI
jgi:hypothetical protein